MYRIPNNRKHLNDEEEPQIIEPEATMPNKSTVVSSMQSIKTLKKIEIESQGSVYQHQDASSQIFLKSKKKCKKKEHKEQKGLLLSSKGSEVIQQQKSCEGQSSARNLINQQKVQRRRRPTALERIMNKTVLNNLQQSQFKNVVMNQKVNVLKKNFIQKLRRNNQHSTPVQYQLQSQQQKSWLNSQGLQLPQTLQKILYIVSLCNISISLFIFTLALVFPHLQDHPAIVSFQVLSALIFILDMVLNFVTKKFSLGRKLQTIQEISQDYFSHRFWIDAISLLIIIMAMAVRHQIVYIFRIFTLLKIPQIIQKLSKIQVFLIQNYYNEQYWSLLKVLIFNYCFAHFLAIVLISMARINTQVNWMKAKALDMAPWYEQYVWSYYWATTIMLTIGFGDVLPVCYQEAACMIFIQTISCIVLAYNINCVGSLIANIRAQDLHKEKNLKVFKKLSDKNSISEDLSSKINNYIEQAANIKKLFNIEQQLQFVQRLPLTYQRQYLKQANKIVFQNLFFFQHLLQRTLLALAQKIQMKIAHPQQLLLNKQHKQHNFDLLILKTGQIAYVSKKAKRDYNSDVADIVSNTAQQKPFIVHTNFLTQFASNYDVKSLVYSVVYSLGIQALLDILRQTNIDFQLYCQTKDKAKNKIDQFQVIQCQFCKTKHTKFDCPKLHFIPLHQHVINKQLQRVRRVKNIRNGTYNRLKKVQKPLGVYMSTKDSPLNRNHKAKGIIEKQKSKIRRMIDQIKFIGGVQEVKQPQETGRFTPQALLSIQNRFLQATSEALMSNVNRMIGRETGQDPVWLVNSDQVKNYSNYFRQDNPSNVQLKTDPQNRKFKRAQKQRQDFIKEEGILLNQRDFSQKISRALQNSFMSMEKMSFKQ